MVADAHRSWSGPAIPETVRRLRGEITRFAAQSGVDDPPLHDVQLAISEALTNVVMHSYRDAAEPGPIDVDAWYTAQNLRIVVADEGAGMRPRADSPGAGFGLPIIAAVAGTLEVRTRQPRGTELDMRFPL